MQDHLTDFERVEHYRRLYSSRGTLVIIFSIIFFILGFLTAKFIYKDRMNIDIPKSIKKL